MGTRIEDLLPPGHEPAKELSKTYGPFNRVLTAGIIALKDHSKSLRDYYVAVAAGHNVIKPGSLQHPESAEELQNRLRELLAEIEMLLTNAVLLGPPKSQRSGKNQ